MSRRRIFSTTPQLIPWSIIEGADRALSEDFEVGIDWKEDAFNRGRWITFTVDLVEQVRKVNVERG